MNPDYMPLGPDYGWLPFGKDAYDYEDLTNIKNEPAWQHSNRRRKPDHVKRAKANRTRAERKRKQKLAKKRGRS